MNKIKYVCSTSDRARAVMAAVVLLVNLSGTASLAIAAGQAHSAKILQGAVSQSAKVGDWLAKLGIHYQEVTAGTSSLLLVDDVTVGSVAFGRGIVKGDCILSIKQSGTTFNLSIGRNGQVFRADLVPLSAVAAHVPAKRLNGSASQSGALLTAQAPALAALAPVATGPIVQQHWPIVPVTPQHWPELNVKQHNIPVLAVDQKPFPVQQIAQDGADGVDQGHFGDCWFEGTLAAFANVPRGQALIASMVKQTAPATYLVTFLGDRKPTTVTREDAQAAGLQDRALWALLIEDACIKNYDPQAVASNLRRGGGPAIQVAMELMTGVPSTVVRPDAYSDQQLGSLLDRLVHQQVPVSLSTKNTRENGGMAPVLTMNHCYALLDYNSSSQEVTLRNAYGYEPNNPNAMSVGVQNLGEGRVQVPVSLLPTYIRYIAYPSSNNY